MGFGVLLGSKVYSSLVLCSRSAPPNKYINFPSVQTVCLRNENQIKRSNLPCPWREYLTLAFDLLPFDLVGQVVFRVLVLLRLVRGSVNCEFH